MKKRKTAAHVCVAISTAWQIIILFNFLRAITSKLSGLAT